MGGVLGISPLKKRSLRWNAIAERTDTLGESDGAVASCPNSDRLRLQAMPAVPTSVAVYLTSLAVAEKKGRDH
jgi:hypothetical protein